MRHVGLDFALHAIKDEDEHDGYIKIEARNFLPFFYRGVRLYINQKPKRLTILRIEFFDVVVHDDDEVN